jgi:hypothetical protein
MFLHGIDKYLGGLGLHLHDVPPATWFGLTEEAMVWTVDYFLFIFVIALIFSFLGLISARREDRSWKENMASYGLPLAAMALLMHISLEGGEFLDEGLPYVMSQAGRLVGGPAAEEMYLLFTPFLVRTVEIFFAFSAPILAMIIIYKVARRREENNLPSFSLPYQVMVFSIGLVFCLCISLT